MKKSDIVVAVVVSRSKKAATEKQIRKELAGVLTHLSLDAVTWDQEVDTVLAQRVIKHIGSVKGELSLEQVVLDIDTILKRIS